MLRRSGKISLIAFLIALFILFGIAIGMNVAPDYEGPLVAILFVLFFTGLGISAVFLIIWSVLSVKQYKKEEKLGRFVEQADSNEKPEQVSRIAGYVGLVQLISMLIFISTVNIVLAIPSLFYGLVTYFSWLFRAVIIGKYPERIKISVWGETFFPKGSQLPETSSSSPESRLRIVAWVQAQWNYELWGKAVVLFLRLIGTIIILFLLIAPLLFIFRREYPKAVFNFFDWLGAPIGEMDLL
jgi:hypothetical protein